jgi:cytoskeleton protein RodZ
MDGPATPSSQRGSPLGSIGNALRSAREAQGKSIQDASAATHIRSAYLEALEEERFSTLGGHVYAKGFLRSYAGFLGLDPAPLVEAYRAQEHDARVIQYVPTPITPMDRRRRAPNWVAVGIVAASIFLAASLYQLVRPSGPIGAADPGFLARNPPATAAPPPPGTRATTTTAPTRGVNVLLRYTAPSWTLVKVDGKVAFQGTPAASEQRPFSADRTVEVILGNAGGVELTVNGKRLGAAGPRGAVWRGSFKPGDPGARG